MIPLSSETRSEKMDNCEVEEIVSSVLDSLIEFASDRQYDAGLLATDGNAEDTSANSYSDLSPYSSTCFVNISEDGSLLKESGEGDGNHFVPYDDSSYEDVTFTQQSNDWQSMIHSHQSYATNWNFYPESSEDLLNLQPHDMCEQWDDDEDKRRKVYWGNRGLIQERYIRTLFRDVDTPDEARPTLARVSSEDMSCGPVPHVTALVTSRRLPSGVSSASISQYRRREFTLVSNDSGYFRKKRKSLFKGMMHVLYKKLVKRWPNRSRQLFEGRTISSLDTD